MQNSLQPFDLLQRRLLLTVLVPFDLQKKSSIKETISPFRQRSNMNGLNLKNFLQHKTVKKALRPFLKNESLSLKEHKQKDVIPAKAGISSVYMRSFVSLRMTTRSTE